MVPLFLFFYKLLTGYLIFSDDIFLFACYLYHCGHVAIVVPFFTLLTAVVTVMKAMHPICMTANLDVFFYSHDCSFFHVYCVH